LVHIASLEEQLSMPTAEQSRVNEVQSEHSSWRRWGPYVSERSWSGVREDYSQEGNAWDYFPHDHARSRAYRWGEDGIAGISDFHQLLVFAPAFWNGRDPILKERLFGVTPHEGNHGEDVKEYYYHLDNTPSHAYMKYLYKYPQQAFPYAELVERNKARNGWGLEYELMDTGIFDDDRYFDIVIEYAKATSEDICIRIEAINRGPEPAPLHILPHLWFRKTWGWDGRHCSEIDRSEHPRIELGSAGVRHIALVADEPPQTGDGELPWSYKLGPRTLYADAGGVPLFTDNESNRARLWGPKYANRSDHTKDAFHRFVCDGEDSVNPQQMGSKACVHYRFDAVQPGESVVVRLRLSDYADLGKPLADVDRVIALRQSEADEFYESIHPPQASEDEKRIQRQALAGLLWSKMTYLFDVEQWLDGDDPRHPPHPERKKIRNAHWRHLNSRRIILPAEKWEYPWFAAWDLAITCVPMAVVDSKFAKEQLWMLLFEQFQHPNGQLPAYEWEFSDMNPPVHAWAVWRVYNMDRVRTGRPDRDFLKRCFHKLLINFAWWVNKVDGEGNNVFEGGFLGLDNISVIDRSAKVTDGSRLEQSDGTGWMGMFCLNLMRISLELAKEDPTYEALAVKFFTHYVYIASAMKKPREGGVQLWDNEDGFFYDLLRFPDGHVEKFRVRSLVGLIPLFAVERLELDWVKPFHEFNACVEWFMKYRRDLTREVVHTVEQNGRTTHVLTIVDQNQIRRIIDRLWNDEEFLSPFGIRSLSRKHLTEPFTWAGRTVSYEPAETQTKYKGGNSNWRGPIWFPTCFLLIESLRKLAKAFGPKFPLNPPAADGEATTFPEISEEIANRLIKVFARDEDGRRPVFGGVEKMQTDPHWKDLILFYEYFHAESGAGLGASHQTGWTALVASLIDEWRRPQ
jgi:hypothetical protein